jgi:hypothetical protein
MGLRGEVLVVLHPTQTSALTSMSKSTTRSRFEFQLFNLSDHFGRSVLASGKTRRRKSKGQAGTISRNQDSSKHSQPSDASLFLYNAFCSPELSNFMSQHSLHDQAGEEKSLEEKRHLLLEKTWRSWQVIRATRTPHLLDTFTLFS